MLTDPYLILELDRKPTDEAVRNAYLNAIRINPPEKNAEIFQRILTAYNSIKTQRLRLEYQWFNCQILSPEDLIAMATSNAPAASAQRPSLASIRALLR